jgi:hypothetical protein
MQDEVFPLLYCLDMWGCLKFAHGVPNRTTHSQIKVFTAKLSHVGGREKRVYRASCSGIVLWAFWVICYFNKRVYRASGSGIVLWAFWVICYFNKTVYRASCSGIVLWAFWVICYFNKMSGHTGDYKHELASKCNQVKLWHQISTNG